MEDGPFSTPEFLRFANDVVLLVINAASPEADAWPKTARGANAAPCSGVCILDVDGNVLARPGRTVEEFVAAHQLCVQLTKLRSMQAPRPPAAEKRLFLVELRLDRLDAQQLAQLDAGLVERGVQALLNLGVEIWLSEDFREIALPWIDRFVREITVRDKSPEVVLNV